MIWTLDQADPGFIAAFEAAGEPDQAVIDAHMRALPARRYPPERTFVKRWYYLLQENPRISLATLGMPLEAWRGPAFFIVGTREIIGEFPANRPYIGMKGLQMKMQPLSWMAGQADLSFASGAQLLAEISEQILDLDAAHRSQRSIKRKYQW